MPDNNPQALLSSQPLLSFLEAAGVTRSCTVRVVGPGALPAILWLCRHGYERVGYTRSLTCTEDADALVVAHSCDEIQLKGFLLAARRLPPGGIFVFQLRGSGAVDRGAVDWLLGDAAFTLDRWLEGERRTLVIARRLGAPAQRMAA